MKCFLVVFLASMMATVNSCEFENYAIQAMYDRNEIFRKTKVFDTTNRTVALQQRYLYEYFEYTNVTKLLAMVINDEDLLEIYKNNAANEIKTISGRYEVDRVSDIRFRRDQSGEMFFEDLLKHDVNFTLPSIDAELPNNVEEENKQVLLHLKTMRQKMFDFQKSLSKDEFERVQYFDYTLYSNGGFYSRCIENGGDKIYIYSRTRDEKETVSGLISCNDNDQKYHVVDGKVAVGWPAGYEWYN